MTSKIINLSMSDVVQGRFPDWANENTFLIQIQDVDYSPTAKFANVKKRDRFEKVYQFRFDDVDNPKEFHCISEEQAKEISEILTKAKEENKNVVVHCHAGICRSGAVVEAAVVALGFVDLEHPRIPNTLVKRMILEKLGIVRSQDYYKSIWDI